MRKNVLALCLAAMIGALGFAGAASADTADPPVAVASADLQTPVAMDAQTVRESTFVAMAVLPADLVYTATPAERLQVQVAVIGAGSADLRDINPISLHPGRWRT